MLVFTETPSVERDGGKASTARETDYVTSNQLATGKVGPLERIFSKDARPQCRDCLQVVRASHLNCGLSLHVPKLTVRCLRSSTSQEERESDSHTGAAATTTTMTRARAADAEQVGTLDS